MHSERIRQGCLAGDLADAVSGFADPVARARSEAGGAVAGVGEAAVFEREAAAADATHEPSTEALELSDLFVDAGAPTGGKLGPVVAFRGVVVGKSVEFVGDFVETEADALREDDERDAAEDGARIAAMARARALGADEAAILIEAEGRGCDTAAASDLGDGEQVGHGKDINTWTA